MIDISLLGRMAREAITICETEPNQSDLSAIYDDMKEFRFVEALFKAQELDELIKTNTQLTFSALQLDIYREVTLGHDKHALQLARSALHELVLETPALMPQFRETMRAIVYPDLDNDAGCVRAALHPDACARFAQTLCGAINADSGIAVCPPLVVIIVFLARVLICNSSQLSDGDVARMMATPIHLIVDGTPAVIDFRLRRKIDQMAPVRDRPSVNDSDASFLAGMLTCTEELAAELEVRYDSTSAAIIDCLSSWEVENDHLMPMLIEFRDQLDDALKAAPALPEDALEWDIPDLVVKVDESFSGMLNIINVLCVAEQLGPAAAVQHATNLDSIGLSCRRSLVRSIVLGEYDDPASGTIDERYDRIAEDFGYPAMAELRGALELAIAGPAEVEETRLEAMFNAVTGLARRFIDENATLGEVADKIGLHHLTPLTGFMETDAQSSESNEGDGAEQLMAVLNVSRERAVGMLQRHGNVELAINAHFGD